MDHRDGLKTHDKVFLAVRRARDQRHLRHAVQLTALVWKTWLRRLQFCLPSDKAVHTGGKLSEIQSADTDDLVTRAEFVPPTIQRL